MALKPRQVAEIVKRYNGGDGDEPGALAAAFETTTAAIKYQLRNAGVYVEPGEKDKAATGPTDEDLGIGLEDPTADAEETVAGDDAISAMLKSPAIAALIEKAVAARFAQLGAAAPVSANSVENNAVVKAVERLIEIQASQQPGYMKPLSANEVEKRSAAHIEMLALISAAEAQYKATRNKEHIPHYILGEMLFDSTAAIPYPEGSEIRTYLQPSEKFVPLNEAARQIHAAFITSIGGPSPDIGARVAEAMIEAKNKDVPIVGGTPVSTQVSAVEVVPQSKLHNVKPNRVLGTITPETAGSTLPGQGGVSAPQGPAFVG